MFTWILLAGLLMGFMIGTFYLFCYWTISIETDIFTQNNDFKRLKKAARIDRKRYDYAYQNNTNFHVDENNTVHQTYDLYDEYNKAPVIEKIQIGRRNREKNKSEIIEAKKNNMS